MKIKRTWRAYYWHPGKDLPSFRWPWWCKIKWNVRGALKAFIWLFTGEWSWKNELSLRTIPGMNGRCYCRTGSQTTLRVGLGEFGFWITLDRWWGAIPCPCDEVVHEVCHKDEGPDCCLVGEMRADAVRE